MRTPTARSRRGRLCGPPGRRLAESVTTDFDPDDRYREDLDARDLQREIETAEEQLERNTRTLADVFIEFMERGDSVEAMVGQVRLSGEVVRVGADVVTLDLGGRYADIALSQLTGARVLTPKAGPGRAYEPSKSETVVARLRELAGARAGTTAELAGRELAPITGTVVAVSGAHVEVVTSQGEEWVIPIASIALVVVSGGD